MRRDGYLSVPVPLSAAIDACRDACYRSLRPYQTFVGGRDDPARAEAMHASVRFIADAAVEANDAHSGSRTFENPAMLSVVDSRHELLAECWDLHAAGARG